MLKKTLLVLVAIILFVAGGIGFYLWTEQVSNETVDSRTLGTTDQHYRSVLLKRIAPNSPDLSALETFVDILEATKDHPRLGEQIGKSLNRPLAFLADADTPESQMAWEFNRQVDAFLADSTHQAEQKKILRSLRIWEANHRPFLATIAQNPSLSPYEEMSAYLAAVARIGQKAVYAIANEQPLPKAEKVYNQQMLDGARKPVLGADLAIVSAIDKLLQKAENDIK